MSASRNLRSPANWTRRENVDRRLAPRLRTRSRSHSERENRNVPPPLSALRIRSSPLVSQWGPLNRIFQYSRSNAKAAGSQVCSVKAGIARGPRRSGPMTKMPDQFLQPEEPVARSVEFDAQPDFPWRSLAVELHEDEVLAVREGLIARNAAGFGVFFLRLVAVRGLVFFRLRGEGEPERECAGERREMRSTVFSSWRPFGRSLTGRASAWRRSLKACLAARGPAAGAHP